MCIRDRIYVSQTVKQAMRTEDVFARYGGEEFAIILRGIDLSLIHI